MADLCLPQLQACRLRIALLDATGAPDPGDTSMVVSKSFTSLATTAVYTDGTETEEKNACDEVEVSFRANDSFKRLDFTLTLLTPDPYLSALMSDGVLLEDGIAPNNRVGYAYPPIGTVSDKHVSIELWAKRINNGVLDPDWPYAHWAFPLAQNLRIGDKEFANGNQVTTISGQLLENTNWGNGPGNDWDWASDRVAQWMPTDTLPSVLCGFTDLVAS